MIIKEADPIEPQVEALTALAARRNVDAGTRKAIEREIQAIRAGRRGERDAAYEIDFHCRESTRLMVIHDLRIAHRHRVAQIDHIILTRHLDLWVCESKAFVEGCGVNEYGEWVRYVHGRPLGMPSPVEQNRRHMAVLRTLFDDDLVDLPTRLGVTLRPNLLSLILVSNNARILRPSGKAAKEVDGLETVIKVEKLVATIEGYIDRKSTLSMAAKFQGSEALARLARDLVALHRPASRDWAARFGLPSGPPTALASAPSTIADPGGSSRSCAKCSRAVSEKVAAYCEANSGRFDGSILCWDCQRSRHDREVSREST